MNRRTEMEFRAAQRAQEDMIAYIQDLAAGVVDPDLSKARRLAVACEKTFRQWVAARAEFTVH